MKADNLIRLISGSCTLAGVALAHWVNTQWIWLTVFAGFGQLQSIFTGFCAPTWLLGRMGWIDERGTIRRPGN